MITTSPVKTASPRRPTLRMSFTRTLSWWAWRYRYVSLFICIGFLSICIEVGIILGLGRLTETPTILGSALGFVGGMLFAFFGNYCLNFRVDGTRFWRTLALFTAISVCSYSLNLFAKDYLHLLNWSNYPMARFITSGSLFTIAYGLHRRFTFRHSAKNFGLAVYASEGTDVQDMFDRIGEHCDHIHIDLVDESFKADAAPVDLNVITKARALWTWQPVMIHIMSKTPLAWLNACIDDVAVALVHVDIDDDIWAVIACCRQAGKSPGIVAHHRIELAQLLPLLPHVEYVLVLGIEKPGCSGQHMMPSALDLAQSLAQMSESYGFKLIFDGGITVDNVNRVPADYIVSSSTVLRAEDPVRACLSLMSGITNERR